MFENNLTISVIRILPTSIYQDNVPTNADTHLQTVAYSLTN